MSEKDEESENLDELEESEIKKLEKLPKKEDVSGEPAGKPIEEIVEKIETITEEVEKASEKEEEIVEEPKEAPEAPGVKLKITTQEGLGGYVLINEGDAQKLNAMEGSVIEFEYPLSGTLGIALARPDFDTPAGDIVMEPSLCEAVGLDEDFEVTVRKFTGKPQKIYKIVFGIESLSGSSEGAIQAVVESK
ncbi:MAG: hypothetical protein Q6366_013520 [Candidatus Freyarchaeota archaeon]